MYECFSCLCIYPPRECSAPRGQKRVSDFLGLEVGTAAMWMLGIKPQSSEEQTMQSSL